MKIKKYNTDYNYNLNVEVNGTKKTEIKGKFVFDHESKIVEIEPTPFDSGFMEQMGENSKSSKCTIETILAVRNMLDVIISEYEKEFNTKPITSFGT